MENYFEKDILKIRIVCHPDYFDRTLLIYTKLVKYLVKNTYHSRVSASSLVSTNISRVLGTGILDLEPLTKNVPINELNEFLNTLWNSPSLFFSEKMSPITL